jgi:hypothetical protein
MTVSIYLIYWFLFIIQDQSKDYDQMVEVLYLASGESDSNTYG